MATGERSVPATVLVPLQQWLERERRWSPIQTHELNNVDSKKCSVLIKSKVAFAVTELLSHAIKQNIASGLEGLKKSFDVNNLMIRFSGEPTTTDVNSSFSSEDVLGVEMISPRLSVQLVAPPAPDKQHLKFEIISPNQSEITRQQNRSLEEKQTFQFLGDFLYQLFSNQHPMPTVILRHMRGTERVDMVDSSPVYGPAQKKIAVQSPFVGTMHPQPANSNTSADREQSNDLGGFGSRRDGNRSPYTTLLELGFMPSISTIVVNLLRSGQGDERADEAYDTLESVSDEFRQLILEPDGFLFGRQAKQALQFGKGKLYGREKERTVMTDALYRVYSGSTECLLIGGASGVGKTSLVRSLKARIKLVSGLLVQEKFDLMNQEPFSTVMAAFNAICREMKKRINPQELQEIVVKIKSEFSSDFALLSQIMPDFIALCPEMDSPNNNVQVDINMQGISFLLQRFIRVLSSTGYIAVIFLDDWQWVDNKSLELIEGVLSGSEGARFFIIGSYRDKEVDPDHPIFEMVKTLEAGGVPASTIQLNGLALQHVNTMISDALGVLPRQCQPLSGLIFHHTKGNPLFIKQSLQSLVERNLVQYSTQEKRWIWDANNITFADSGDVLSLFSAKIRGLPDSVQSALRTLACFGMQIDEEVIQRLSSIPKFANLPHDLDLAAEAGFVTKSGGKFRFVHDKIQEAALSSIADRESYHFELGTWLHSVSPEGNQLDRTLFVICDQFKMAPSYLYKNLPMSTNIIGLFVNAGCKAMKSSDFPRARSYFLVAESMLPVDHWISQYNLSLRLFFFRAKSSRSCGFIEEAKGALQQILLKGQSLVDKFDANYLMASILFDCNEWETAYEICSQVISQLDKPIPSSVDREEVKAMVIKSTQDLNSMSDNELLEMHEASSSDIQVTLKFYGLLVTLSFVSKPEIIPICVCNMVQLCLKNGVSGYSALAFALYAAMLCYNLSLKDIPTAQRMAKIAMAFDNRFDLKNQMPILMVCCYGLVGVFSDPFQKCADMNRLGFDHGMFTGNSTYAFYNPHYHLRSALFSGENLPKLLVVAENYLSIARKFKHSHALVLIGQYRDTFLALIGKGGSGGPSEGDGCPSFRTHTSNFQMAMQCFWLRHHERFEFFCKKVVGVFEDGSNIFFPLILKYFHALNYSQQRKGKYSQTRVSTLKSCIKEMKSLSDASHWNYNNKIQLLQAEVYSADGPRARADEAFAVAIRAAQDSKFVHEEGLAHELAGFHYLGIQEKQNALDHFKQAKKCYSEWGSAVKVDFIEKEIIKMKQIARVSS